MKIINLIQGSPNWLEWRRSGIGASDIAAICGVCPYRSALDVYNDKMGFKEQKQNANMARGSQYEDEARRVFNRNRVTPFVPIICESDKHSYFRASLDGYDQFTRYILEIKIPNRKVLDMARYDQIPIHYLYQIQWQLMVTDSPVAFYFCYNPDTLESYTVDVFPDEEIINTLIDKGVEFWFDNILKEIPPKDKSDRKVIIDTSRDRLIRMGKIKECIKTYQEEYDKEFACLLEEEGVEISLECDKHTLQRCERSTVDYKQAAIDSGLDLKKYTKPTTVYWTLKNK